MDTYSTHAHGDQTQVIVDGTGTPIATVDGEGRVMNTYSTHVHGDRARGYEARCSCGWSSLSYARSIAARIMGRNHLRESHGAG